MELTRRAFMKWLAGAVALVAGGGWLRLLATSRNGRADPAGDYPGPMHPLDESSIRRMGKWMG